MMRTAFVGVVVLCLLLIIQDNNMITEGSVYKLTKYSLNWMKCCTKNCKLNDLCYPRSKGLGAIDATRDMLMVDIGSSINHN